MELKLSFQDGRRYFCSAMPHRQNIQRVLRYPLMGVMLLWALTLPGHELAVYSFLVTGSVSDIAPSLLRSTGEQDSASVKQQVVQVFLDANTASPVTLSPLQAFRCVWQLFAFAPPTDDVPSYASDAAGAERIAQIFPIAIQPNGP